jgi:hypothetical protein
MPDETIESYSKRARQNSTRFVPSWRTCMDWIQTPKIFPTNKTTKLSCEAEELIKKSDPLGQYTIDGLPDELERLLAQYHDIDRRLFKQFVAVREELTGRGVIVDSGKKS